MSIASISANENMPIILSGMDKISTEATEFIGSNNINKSYIVGGDSVVSSDLESKLPNATRISGKNRKETNANVINTFFTDKEIDNLYIAKDGMQNENQLIDALSVGSLAAKTNSPVMIAGNSLDKSQRDLVNSKFFKTITQVGGNGNESAFDEIKDIQNDVIESKPSTSEKNDKGLGDETYDALKALGWKVESSNVLSYRNGKIKFENLNGKNNEDARLIIKGGSSDLDKDTLEVLNLMHGKDSQYSADKLQEMINAGTGTIKDGSRYIDIKYDGNIFYTLTITFSNFGITPVHEASEGTNKNGFGDTTYEELKNSGWKVDSNDRISSNKENVSFTNVGGAKVDEVDEVDAILDIKGEFDSNDKDLIYALSLMLNSHFDAKELANEIKEGYDKGVTRMVISGKYSTIIVDIPKDKSSVKIIFKNIYSNNLK